MSSLFLQGVTIGLSLSILMGPIVIALIQTTLERGGRAGITVALGIWTSDIVYILFSLWSLSLIEDVLAFHHFKLFGGIIGGIILIVFGIVLILRRVPEKMIQGQPIKADTFFQYWFTGFSVNTFNPFTIFFWVAVITTVVHSNQLSNMESSSFLIGLMGTVILFDSLKVFFARKIRNKLRPSYIGLVTRIAGSAFILFGIALILRVSL